MLTFEVSTYYLADEDFHLDDAATQAVGRESDSSGWGCGERDLSWECETRSEALKVERALAKIGLPTMVSSFER